MGSWVRSRIRFRLSTWQPNCRLKRLVLLTPNRMSTMGLETPERVHEQAIVVPIVAASDAKLVSTLSIQRLGAVAIGAVVIWLLVASIMLVRLCVAWWKLVHLRRSAIQVDTEIANECYELSRLMKVTAPNICRSPFLPSPCLAGLRKPVILLPDDDFCLSMRNVLIHELAHLRRRDCHWNLLRQLGNKHCLPRCRVFGPSPRVERTPASCQYVA